MLGLGNSLKKIGLVSPGIVTDNLIMKHMYPAGAVQLVSDGAAYFDGTNSEINCGSASSLDVGVNNFTATCWFNPSSITASGHIMGKGTGLSGEPYDGRGWACTIYSGNSKIYFDIYGGTDGSATEDVRLNVIIPGALPSANRWYHLAVTRTTSGTSSLYTIYIDGVLEVQSEAADGGAYDAISAGEAINDAGNDFTIGESNTSGADFTGYICNVGYWVGRGLTQPEIKSIMFKQYADLTTTEKTSLVSFWNLDSTVADGIPLVYDENNTTLGPDLWSITDPIGPDTLGGADGDKNASMDLSDVGLAAGDVIKLSGTISGSNGGKILAPDVGAASSGVTRIPSDADYQHTEDGDIEVYMYVSDVTGKLKIRTDHDAGSSEDDRTQKISNIKVQKVTNAGRLI